VVDVQGMWAGSVAPRDNEDDVTTCGGLPSAPVGKRPLQDARERAKAALERAKNAERTVKRVKGIPGLKGRLVQWLVGDVLSD
jgi:hypothetical protein